MVETYINRCGTCGEPMLGSHYHEPECAACGAECEDLSDLDPQTGRWYCVNCGADLNPKGARVLPDGRPCLAIRDLTPDEIPGAVAELAALRGPE